MATAGLEYKLDGRKATYHLSKRKIEYKLEKRKLEYSLPPDVEKEEE